MGYRASNRRDRDAAIQWRSLPLSERLRRVNWAMVALVAFSAAAFAVPLARRWLG
jgi:hypothetical protein